MGRTGTEPARNLLARSIGWPAELASQSVERSFDAGRPMHYLANVINDRLCRKALPTMPMARQPLFGTLAALAAGAMLAAGPAAAVLYKWVDANGRVSYSDQPPPGNVKAEIVGGGSASPATTAAVAPDAVRDMASQDLELKKRAAQRVAEQKKTEKLRADAVQQQQACEDARNQIKMLDSDQLILNRINEKGEPVYLDEAMRNKERERLGLQIRQNCAG